RALDDLGDDLVVGLARAQIDVDERVAEGDDVAVSVLESGDGDGSREIDARGARGLGALLEVLELPDRDDAAVDGEERVRARALAVVQEDLPAAEEDGDG